uniref:Uncharacterized protein n=1 Tax=Timema tahoe TaxID=61484 RepID=A0A7R9IMZ3_9NEOP|nr:unnamed protein product [Timema tahoe]
MNGTGMKKDPELGHDPRVVYHWCKAALFNLCVAKDQQARCGSYRQRLCRLPGVFLPTLLSERLRKRRAFADRELETALPPPFMSVLSPFPLPLWRPVTPQTPTRPAPPPPDNDTDAPKPKPKISFSVESIIGVK